MASPFSIISEIHRRPGFLLKRCHQVAVAVFLAECREFGITPSQYACLQVLSACPDIDQLMLGRLVGLDRSTIGLVVRLLAKRGLIERTVDERDKRKLCLRLTRSGTRISKEMAPAAARVSERVLAVLPRGSRAGLVRLMQAFLEGHRAAIDVNVVLAGGDCDEWRTPPTSRPARPRYHRSRSARVRRRQPRRH
jgi:DNA-binding MarR family transcriptional regulator